MRKKKSSSSRCSAGSEGSGSDWKGVIRLSDIRKARKPRGYKNMSPTIRSGRTGLKVWDIYNRRMRKKEDVGTLRPNFTQGSRAGFLILGASGPTTMTNGPAKFTEKGSDIKSLLKGIFGKLTPILFPILNYLPLDSHAKLSQSLENAKDSKIQGELFSLKSAEYLKLRNPDGFYLRTLKGFLAMIKDTHSKSSYPRWMNWGLMCNGKCLTLKLSYPKIARGSLSSVLEEKANEKYYLSDKNLAKIFEKKDAHPNIRWKSGIRGEGKVQFPDRVDKPSRTITPAEGGANRMTHGIMVLADILEEKVGEKYYLSEAMHEYIFRKTHHKVPVSDPDGNLESPIREQGDKPMVSSRIDANYNKGWQNHDQKVMISERGENGQIQQSEKKRNNVQDKREGYEDGGRLQKDALEARSKRIQEASRETQDRHSVPEVESGDIPRQLLLARMPDTLQGAEDSQGILDPENRRKQEKGQEDNQSIEERGLESDKDLGTHPEDGYNDRKSGDKDKGVVRIGGIYDKKGKRHQAGSIYDSKGISPIVDTAQGGHREPLIIADRTRTYAKKGRNLESPKPISNALSGVQKDNLIIANTVYKRRIRRLTPRECERLQGFPDDWTAEGMDVNGNKTKISDTQRYKTMGNAVSIPVIEAIGKTVLRNE